MKRALIVFGLAIALTMGFMGFSQVGAEKKSLCTVRGYGPQFVKSIKGIYIYKGHEPVKKIESKTTENFEFHAELHNVLQNLYDEGWQLVGTNNSGEFSNYPEYLFEK